MRQLTYVGPRKLEWWDVPTPRVQSDADALVSPLSVARCDLDLYIAQGHPAFPGPFAIGHEMIGVVTEVGDKAGVRIGDTVVVPFQLSCGRCDECALGFTNTCREYPRRAAFGLAPSCGREFGGALSESVRVPYADHMLIPFPAHLDNVHFASIADNIPDGWRAVAPHLKARPGARVLVISAQAQSVGLYAAGLAVSLGASEVLYLDDDDGRRQRAARMGARTEPLNLPREPLQFEITVHAMADESTLRFGLLSTVPNGVFTQIGMFFSDEVPMPLRSLYARGIAFHTGRVHARAELPGVLAHCERGGFDASAVTSRVVNFSDAAEGILDPSPKIVFVNDWAAGRFKSTS
jgi:threonine dehydrogenase-like Zn-dependent dehydrogenase